MSAFAPAAKPWQSGSALSGLASWWRSTRPMAVFQSFGASRLSPAASSSSGGALGHGGGPPAPAAAAGRVPPAAAHAAAPAHRPVGRPRRRPGCAGSAGHRPGWAGPATHRLEGDRRSQDRVLRRSLGGRTGRGRSCRSTGTCRCGSWLPAPSKSDRSLVGARTGPAANNSSRPGWVSQGRPRRRAGRTHYGGAESGEAPAVDGRLTRVAESTANASTVIHSFIRPGSASPQSTSSWPCPAPTLR